jgi:hypothetical protein
MRPEKFKTICSNDPAIDTTKIDVKVYVDYLNKRESLDSIRHAFSTDGPTIYCIREIPSAYWDWVDEPDNFSLKYKRAFMYGVERVENLMQTDGTRLGSVSGSKTVPCGNTQIDVMQEHDLKYFSPLERQEIGAVAYQHSFLHRKIESDYPLQPASLRLLERREFLSVAASRTSPATPSEEPSASEAT